MTDMKRSTITDPESLVSSATMHMWTEARLLADSRRFVLQKPSSLHLCLFIDGLDEFDGETESLLALVDLLKDARTIKICVSSPPENFRLDFRNAPQISMEDANRKDNEEAAKGRPLPLLQEAFPERHSDVDRLIKIVSYKAEGIFLWAELVIREIDSKRHS